MTLRRSDFALKTVDIRVFLQSGQRQSSSWQYTQLGRVTINRHALTKAENKLNLSGFLSGEFIHWKSINLSSLRCNKDYKCIALVHRSCQVQREMWRPLFAIPLELDFTLDLISLFAWRGFFCRGGCAWCGLIPLPTWAQAGLWSAPVWWKISTDLIWHSGQPAAEPRHLFCCTCWGWWD